MAKTAAEWQALLDKVDAQIEDVVENGQSITQADGSTLTRPTLESLLKMQAYYQKRIDTLADAGTSRRVAEFF
jgi:hypothetical protein